MSESWFEDIMELNRYAKETGKSFRTGRATSSGGTTGGDDVHSQALRSVMKSMGSGRAGVQPRGVKKDRGGPTPGPTMTPGQKVQRRRDAAQRAKEFMNDTRGT